MKVEIPTEALDEFFVQFLKDGLNSVRDNKWVKHPEDIINNIKVEAAFVTLLEYHMTHSDFFEFIKETYRGSKSDS